MEYRRLGKSGLKISALSFGSWVTFGNQLNQSHAQELMTTAYDAGVNFFDNAEIYADGQSEILMGEVLKKNGVGTRHLLRLEQSVLGRRETHAARPQQETYH